MHTFKPGDLAVVVNMKTGGWNGRVVTILGDAQLRYSAFDSTHKAYVYPIDIPVPPAVEKAALARGGINPIAALEAKYLKPLYDQDDGRHNEKAEWDDSSMFKPRELVKS